MVQKRVCFIVRRGLSQCQRMLPALGGGGVGYRGCFIYPRSVDSTSAHFQSLVLQQNVPLAPFTTLRIGGPARYFAEITSEAGLLEAVGFARERRLPLFVLGGGSNLLVADEGFDGIVLKIALGGETAVEKADGKLSYTVPAGVDWDAFVLSVCAQGISGVECLAGIPGLVGGTPVQNVGAYGQEVAETITEVRGARSAVAGVCHAFGGGVPVWLSVEPVQFDA